MSHDNLPSSFLSETGPTPLCCGAAADRNRKLYARRRRRQFVSEKELPDCLVKDKITFRINFLFSLPLNLSVHCPQNKNSESLKFTAPVPVRADATAYSTLLYFWLKNKRTVFHPLVYICTLTYTICFFLNIPVVQ